ncbi:gone early [Carabus blaptoides fortunei]
MVRKMLNRVQRVKKIHKLREKSGLSRKGLLIAGAVLLVLLLLLITVIALGAAWPRTPHHRQFPVCEDTACLRAAAQIREGLNSSAPACSDTWNWACGGWLKKNSLPAERSLWNQRQQLQTQESARIRDLIATLPLPVHTGTLEWKLKHLYESCIEIDNVDADGIRPLQQIITELGGWHIMREWSVHSWDYRRVLERLHAEYGATPFFKITVESNPHSPLNNSIRISPSGLGLPDRNFYYADPDNKIINAYKRLLKDIVVLLRATSSEAIKFSTDIFYYEKRLAEITPESTLLQDPIYTYNPISVSELKITAASLPLREILVSMFPNAGITDETEILVSSPDYLTAVSGIVSSTDRSALNNYVIWTLVREYLPYLPSDYAAELHQYTSELTGVRAPLKRWESCTNMIQRFMGLAVQCILENHNPISESTALIVQDIFKNIRNAALKHTADYNFPSELHKHISQKISGLTIHTGFPKNITSNTYLKNYYSKLYVQKSNLFQNIFNGFSFLRKEQQQRFLEPHPEYQLIPFGIKENPMIGYSAPGNSIIVPRALLTSPYFEPGYPRSIIYGRLGVDMANAVVASMLPWENTWTREKGLLSPYHLVVNQSIKAISNPRQCLMNFLLKHNYATQDVANITSLSTLKHLSALRLADTALTLALENKDHIHQPTLELYEDAALFYITYSQSHCSKYTSQQELLDNYVHFKLADTILLQISRLQVPNFSNALQCTHDTEAQCKEIL